MLKGPETRLRPIAGHPRCDLGLPLAASVVAIILLLSLSGMLITIPVFVQAQEVEIVGQSLKCLRLIKRIISGDGNMGIATVCEHDGMSPRRVTV